MAKATKVLTALQLAELERLHRAAAKRLLLAEAASQGLLRPPVAAATDRLIANAARSPDPDRAALVEIRNQAERLEVEFRGAVLAARQRSRELGRAQSERELAPIGRYASENGLPAPAPLRRNVIAAIDLDQFEAQRAGASMSAAWSSATYGGLQRWQRDGAGSLASALDATVPSAKRVDQHAAAQATTAYADEQRSFWDEVRRPANDTGPPEDSGEPALPHGWEPGLFRIWSAILDRRTCPACQMLDGTMVPAQKPFPGGVETPLHNLCRCIVIVYFVPEALSKKLPGITIDYSALKEDVRDYMRGTNLNGLIRGKRHAGDFLRDAAASSGPEALLKRVSNRRAYRARQ